MQIQELLVRKKPEDITTIQLRIKTRDELDRLGFSRHDTYDFIVSGLIKVYKESKKTWIDDELYQRIRKLGIMGETYQEIMEKMVSLYEKEQKGKK